LNLWYKVVAFSAKRNWSQFLLFDCQWTHAEWKCCVLYECHVYCRSVYRSRLLSLSSLIMSPMQQLLSVTSGSSGQNYTKLVKDTGFYNR